MSGQSEAVIYKICSAADWDVAVQQGEYAGSRDDARDGYIHLSTAAQLPGTAAKYFSGRSDLVLVAFAADAIGTALRWEPARGGALFPHVYAPLQTQQALWIKPLALGPDGVPRLPEDL